MFKRLTAALLLLAVLAALLPVPARAAEGKGQAAEQVWNSDLEAAFDGTCWYVDTMGAGDSYIAGFLYAHLRGFPMEACMLAGSQNSAITIGYTGAW